MELTMIVESRVAKLRTQHQFASKALKSKIEMRVNRIPKALWNKTFRELIQERTDKELNHLSLSPVKRAALSRLKMKTHHPSTHLDSTLVIPKLRPDIKKPPISNPLSPNHKSAPAGTITSPTKKLITTSSNPSIKSSLRSNPSPAKTTISPIKNTTTASPIKSFMRSPLKSARAASKRIISGSKPIPSTVNANSVAAVTSGQNPPTSTLTKSTAATRNRKIEATAAPPTTPAPRRILRSRVVVKN